MIGDDHRYNNPQWYLLSIDDTFYRMRSIVETSRELKRVAMPYLSRSIVEFICSRAFRCRGVVDLHLLPRIGRYQTRSPALARATLKCVYNVALSARKLLFTTCQDLASYLNHPVTGNYDRRSSRTNYVGNFYRVIRSPSREERGRIRARCVANNRYGRYITGRLFDFRIGRLLRNGVRGEGGGACENSLPCKIIRHYETLLRVIVIISLLLVRRGCYNVRKIPKRCKRSLELFHRN